jgi:hypothetical protein
VYSFVRFCDKMSVIIDIVNDHILSILSRVSREVFISIGCICFTVFIFGELMISCVPQKL